MLEMVNRLQLPKHYVAARSHIFGNKHAFNWFVRSNLAELVATQALVRPTGRWLVQPDAFDEAVLSIGARRASVAPGGQRRGAAM